MTSMALGSTSRIAKQNLDDSLDEENVDLKNLKRSRLMNKEIMDWAKKRSMSAIKKQYVHYPQDLKKMQEIKNVFLQIDKDGSRSLDKDEINEMFSKYDFYIDPDYLDQLFRVVDDDQDNALNWQEFKKCALNDNATRIFNYMMRKAREKANENKEVKQTIQVIQDIATEDIDNYEEYEQALLNQEKQNKLAQLMTQEEEDEQKVNYIPLRFLEVISYLSYLSERDEIIDKVNSAHDRISKFRAFQELFVCNKDYSKSYMDSKKQEMDLLRQRKSLNINSTSKHRVTIRNHKDLDSFLQRMTVIPFDANQKRQKNETKAIPLDYRERKEYKRSDAKPEDESFSQLLMNKSEKLLKIPSHLLSVETMKKQQVKNINEIDQHITKVLKQNEQIKTEITKNQFVISDKIKSFISQANLKFNRPTLNNNSQQINPHSILKQQQDQHKLQEFVKQTSALKQQQQQTTSDSKTKSRPESQERRGNQMITLERNLSKETVPSNQRAKSRPESQERRGYQMLSQEKYYAYQSSNNVKKRLKTIGCLDEDNSEFNDHEISQSSRSNSLNNNYNDNQIPKDYMKSINQINKISESKLKKSLGFSNFEKIVGSNGIRNQATPPKISIVYNKVLSSDKKLGISENSSKLPTISNSKAFQETQTKFTNTKINQYLEKVHKAKLDSTLSAKRIFGSSQQIKRHLSASKNKNMITGDAIPLRQVKQITRWVDTNSVAQNADIQSQFIPYKNAIQRSGNQENTINTVRFNPQK